MASKNVEVMREAHRVLSSLKVGDKVLFSRPGMAKTELVVQQPIRGMDGNGYGSWDYASVTVGYGPGRWNTEVNAAGIAFGSYTVEPAS